MGKDIDRSPHLYRLEDLLGKRLPNPFYAAELYPALSPDSEEGKRQLHMIEKIVAKKTVNKKKMVLCKFVGYDKRLLDIGRYW